MKNPEGSDKVWGAGRSLNPKLQKVVKAGCGNPGCKKFGAMSQEREYNFKSPGEPTGGSILNIVCGTRSVDSRKLSRKGRGAGDQLHLEAERKYRIWREYQGQINSL